ncbi:MAG: baseplate J/gp47 family protein [Jatrophihabitantaceae bacterium]
MAELTDPLQPGVDLLRVFWDASEALQAPVPCSVDQSAGAEVGVARLGLLPAHHGLLVDGPGTLAPIDPLTSLAADPQTSEISDYLLVAAGPEAAPGLAHAPGGRPWQLEVTVTLPNGTRVPAERVTSMLRSPAGGFSVVIDADDELPARMRFRTGALGLVPPAGSVVSARYQVGAGPAGNVAANVTTRLVRCTSAPGVPCVWDNVTDDHHSIVTARNVTPGTGGAVAMSLDDVRRDAPQAYSAVPRRAVLIGDLAPFAATVPTVLRAAVRRSWSGSWPVGVVAYEPVSGGQEGTAYPAAAAQLQARVQSTLDAVRMAGTEVVSVTATPVGILIALTVCLYPGSDSDAARAAILASLRPGTPDAPGLFAPGSFPMGTDVYLSTVVAAVAALPAVDAVAVTEARRLSDPPGTLDAVLIMGPTEVAVCDDDPSAPDRGRILLTVRGGR